MIPWVVENSAGVSLMLKNVFISIDIYIGYRTCLFVSDTRLARNVSALLLGISIQKTKFVL